MSHLSRIEIAKQIEDHGFYLAHNVFPTATLELLKTDLIKGIASEEAFHQKKDHPDRGMVLVCPYHAKSFSQILANERFVEPFNAVLGDGCIVYAYTSSSMPPHEGNYSVRVHVDSPRLIENYVTNMGVILLLDDFTEENGATYYLPGSHKRREAPSEQEFLATAKRLIAPKGSAFYFNARLWHSGAANKSETWRHAVTINMCRSFMKQRIDLPRLLEKTDLTGLSEASLQKLGFLTQVPASFEEYYAPFEKRKYRQKAE